MQIRTFILAAFILTTVAGWSSPHHTRFQDIHCHMQSFQRPRALNAKITTTQNQFFTTNVVGSTNWSGYAAAPASHPNGSVSYVSGVWTVPTLQATPNTSYTAIWVGIDGFGSSTVEQLGTSHDWVNGKQENYAWFEMYPQGSYQITGFPVNPGDQISASVTYTTHGVFILEMTNITRGVTTTIPTSYTTNNSAQRSSAEWVVEAPYSNEVLPLSDFNLITMNLCTATINNVLGSINNNHWVNDKITMITSSGAPKAVPSTFLTEGTCFNVQWDHE